MIVIASRRRSNPESVSDALHEAQARISKRMLESLGIKL